MTSAGKCPRGHELAENAVYCTVCWIRVEPEDPERVAARRRHRRRVWIPFLAASSVLVGVVVGGVVGVGSVGSSTSVAAQEEPASPSAAGVEASPEATPESSPDASPEEQPVDTAVAPLAATVVESSPALGCTADVLDQTVACTESPQSLAFTLCVPDGTVRVKVSTRETADDEWQPVSSEATFDDAADCAEGSVTADITILEATAGTSEAAWRVAGRDDANDKLWKSRLVVTLAS